MCYKRSKASSVSLFCEKYSCSEFFCVLSGCALLLVLTSLKGRSFVFYACLLHVEISYFFCLSRKMRDVSMVIFSSALLHILRRIQTPSMIKNRSNKLFTE